MSNEAIVLYNRILEQKVIIYEDMVQFRLEFIEHNSFPLKRL